MINIRHLIDFLPLYFKDKDTYKVDGKGILERFLEICGNYFTDNIKSVIDNSLDIIDLDKTSSQYLALLWELLGQIPFANKAGTPPFNLTKQQQVDLIQYCNELLKIRGSKEFFEIMFRMYHNETNNLQLVSIVSDDVDWDKDIRENREYIKKREGTTETKGSQTDRRVLWPYSDKEVLDDQDISFDEYHRMKQCIDVTFTITGQFKGNDTSAYKAIRAFIERFVPYNVHPIIKVNGVLLTDKYDLVLEILEDGIWKVPKKDLEKDPITLSNDERLRVRVYAIDELGKPVEGVRIFSNINGGTVLSRTSVYEFVVSNVLEGDGDTYMFTLDNESITPKGKRKTLKVKSIAEKSVSYGISIDKSSEQLSKSIRKGTCRVTAYRQVEGGSKEGVSVMCLQTGEVKTPSSGTVTEWEFVIPGTYTFVIVGHTGSQVNYELKAFNKKYQVLMAEAIYHGSGGYSPGNFVPELKLNSYDNRFPKFFVKVICNDPEVKTKDLQCHILGAPFSKYSPDTPYEVPGFGIYTFIPDNAKSGDGSTNATLTVTNGEIIFTTAVSKQEKLPSIIDNDHQKTWAEIKADPKTNAAKQVLEQGQGITMVVKLPDGTQVEITKGQKKQGSGYVIEMTSNDTVRITSYQRGTYLCWVKVYPSSKAVWHVKDIRSKDHVPAKLIVRPEDDTKAWSGENTSSSTYQLSETDKEARYSLCLVDDNGNNVEVRERVTEVETGKSFMLDSSEVLSKTEKGVFNYTVTVDGKKFTAKVQIKDFETKVVLTCTPSIAMLNNGQAISKISITSNKPGVTLKARLKNTGDQYSDGDQFVANKAMKYVFTAMADGKPVKDEYDAEVKATFTVIDPTQIAADPTKIVFEADGSVTKTGDVINIVAGEDTDWVLITQG